MRDDYKKDYDPIQEICICLCHELGAQTRHCMPCCVKCKCGKNIKGEYYDSHLKNCVSHIDKGL